MVAQLARAPPVHIGSVMAKGESNMPMPMQKKTIPKVSSVLSHALIGTLGSVLAEAMLFPVDSIRLRVQTAGRDGAGFVEMGRKILQESGPLGLYSGLAGAIIKESVHSMNFWIFHGLIFRWASSHGNCARTPPMKRLFLNLIAKQLNWLCTVPFEVVSQANQLAPGCPGFFTTAMKLYKEHGCGAYYRGLFASLLLAVNPAMMHTLVPTFLSLFTTLKAACGVDMAVAKDHGAGYTVLATGISKACATIVTYPLIRAKVLQQTQISGRTMPLTRVLFGIAAAEGVRGLYRGIIAMSYKTIIWNSLMMSVRHSLGARTPVSSPGTPRPEVENSEVSVHFFGREPFPLEVLSKEKLNDILRHLQLLQSTVDELRVDSIEARLCELSSELKEAKTLLLQLADFVKSSEAQLQQAVVGI